MPPPLRDYQQVAAAFLRGRDRCLLLLRPGLGKTASTLTALEDRHLPVLVVAPLLVARSVWHVETAKWRPDLSVIRALGTPEDRKAALLDDEADIVVASMSTISEIAPLLAKRRTPFRTIVVDEVSKTRNRGALYKSLKKIAFKAPYFFGLTGTPAPNGLMDLFPQVFLVDAGKRLGTNITGFRGRYFMAGRQITNGTVVEWNIREFATDHIYGLIEDIALGMGVEHRLELPPLTINYVDVELPASARKAYREMAKRLATDLRDVFGPDAEIHTAANAAVASSKLSQITAGMLYVDDADLRKYRYTVLHTEKMKALAEILEAESGPVLIYYRFNSEREALENLIEGVVHISEPDAIERWDRRELKAMIAHPASASHGLNLQHGGSTIVWTTPTWDAEQWEQANARLFRSGQTEPVIVHVLSCPSTVDTLIRARIEDKLDTQQSLMDHLESPV